MTRPNCILAGAAKAGTTSLYHYLSKHPQVFLPSEIKEINYFSGSSKRIRSQEDYCALYKGSENFPVRMDISTSYLYDPATAGRIKDFLGEDIKIIFILRNPVDAGYSLWKQIRHFGTEPLSFEDALSAENARMNDPNVRKTLQGWAPWYFYTNRYVYMPQLEPYLKRFPRKNIAIYIYEEFFADIEKSWNDICAFLNVDPSFRPSGLGKVHNPSGHGVRSGVLQKILYENRWWTKIFSCAIPRGSRNRLRLALDDINKKPPATDDFLAKDTRRKLEKFFSDDVRSLEKEIERPLKDLWF